MAAPFQRRPGFKECEVSCLPARPAAVAPIDTKRISAMSNMQHELMDCISTENKRLVINHINSRGIPEAIVYKQLSNLMVLALITDAATPPASISAKGNHRTVDSDVAGSIARALIRLHKKRLILSKKNDCEFRTAKFKNLLPLLRLTNR